MLLDNTLFFSIFLYALYIIRLDPLSAFMFIPAITLLTHASSQLYVFSCIIYYVLSIWEIMFGGPITDDCDRRMCKHGRGDF